MILFIIKLYARNDIFKINIPETKIADNIALTKNCKYVYWEAFLHVQNIFPGTKHSSFFNLIIMDKFPGRTTPREKERVVFL